jgi:acyl-CoA hydrolase
MSEPKVNSRRVAESQAERSEIIFPADTNALGNLFGGRLMQWIDLVGAVSAVRHSRAIVVTASIDHSDFVAPAHVGDLLILKASVNRAFRTSMEVGVRAMVEDALGQRHLRRGGPRGPSHPCALRDCGDRAPEAALCRCGPAARDARRRDAAGQGDSRRAGRWVARVVERKIFHDQNDLHTCVDCWLL